MGVALSSGTFQLGLNFATDLPELFAGKAMGEEGRALGSGMRRRVVYGLWTFTYPAQYRMRCRDRQRDLHRPIRRRSVMTTDMRTGCST